MMGMTDKSREQLLKLGVNMGDPEMQFMAALSNFMNLRCSAIGLAEGSPWAKDLQALKESCFYITKKQYKVDLAKIASDQHDSISEMKTKISQQLEKANEKKN